MHGVVCLCVCFFFLFSLYVSFCVAYLFVLCLCVCFDIPLCLFCSCVRFFVLVVCTLFFALLSVQDDAEGEVKSAVADEAGGGGTENTPEDPNVSCNQKRQVQLDVVDVHVYT